MDGPGFEDRQVRETSFLQNRPDQFWDSLNLRFAGYWGSLSGEGRGGVMRPWSEVDHSTPSSADVKNAWGCTSASPVCRHG